MQQSASGMALPFPATGVDPRVALATAMHAGPGVYAVLVGSGMSSAAGIPTGWQVVQDLVRRIARAEGADLEASGEAPEAWWAAQGRPELRYDTLLAALGTTDAARQILIRRYFDLRADDGGPVEPTPAHDALATLVASGRVRLILTTNFDRLIERALDQHGVAAQVIADPRAMGGMVPLVHAPATVLKLHGDYAMIGLRNTPDELASYPPQWEDLLARVFDEYGLLVVGWSGDYDVALANALSTAPSRRYPMFWTTLRGHIREAAARLVALRQATVIHTAGADEFLADLADRVARLDHVAARRQRASPLRTHRYIPNEGSAPSGWSVMPLFQLRAACSVGPATEETTGRIMPEQRERIVAALIGAPLTARLRDLSLTPPAPALAEPTEGTPALLLGWEPTPGGYQTMDSATYRMGGDASRGVAALASITLPGQPYGGVVVVTLDLGISIARPLFLHEVASLMRDALVLVATRLADAIDDILPSAADVMQVETYLLAARNDGSGKTRPNSLSERVDLSPLGLPSREPSNLMGFAAQIPEPLTEHAAAELVLTAVEQGALMNGFLDPRAGLALLRADLGLPPQASSP